MRLSQIGKSHLATDGLRTLEGPVARQIMNQYFPRTVITPGAKEGPFAYRKSDVEAYVIAFKWATNTEQAFMNITNELKENYEEVKALWEGYEKRLTEFRSAIKNDIASLEAGARKTTAAVHQMNKSYGDVIAQMNGPEMATAIANAERLSTAMTALAGLKPQELTFNVLGQK